MTIRHRGTRSSIIKLRYFHLMGMIVLLIVTLYIRQGGALAKPTAGSQLSPDDQAASCSAGDSFLMGEELPPGMSDHSGFYEFSAYLSFGGMLADALLLFGIPLILYPKEHSQESTHDTAAQVRQDQGGFWWYQDPSTAVWYIWNGQVWRPIPGAAPRIAPTRSVPTPAHGPKSSHFVPRLLALLTGGLVGLFIIGGITLMANNFFPGYHIKPGQGDLNQILKLGGGGLLATAFGLLMLARGFGTLLAGRVGAVDERGRRIGGRGCRAILDGLGQLFFGFLFLSTGLALVTLAVYQEMLPWLGF